MLQRRFTFLNIEVFFPDESIKETSLTFKINSPTKQQIYFTSIVLESMYDYRESQPYSHKVTVNNFTPGEKYQIKLNCKMLGHETLWIKVTN